MKTQVTVTIDSDIKEKLQQVVKRKGINMSALVNMYFIKVIETGKIDYYGDDESVEMGFIPWEKISKEDKEAYKRIKNADKSCFLNI